MVLRVAPNKVNNLSYFKAIEKQMDTGGYEALMYFLKNRKYNEDTVKTIIKTEALTAQKEQNLPPVMRWWRSCLSLGQVGFEQWPRLMLTRSFYHAYIAWCDEQMVRERETEDWLPRRLNDMSGIRLVSKGPGGSKHYELPDLMEARIAFDTAVGYKTGWVD